MKKVVKTYLCGLASHDDELLCTLHQEAGKLVAQNFFDFVGLFNFNGHSDRVNGWLDQASLILTSGNNHLVQY